MGTEIACLGYGACYGDSYWARYAGVSNSTVIEAGYQWRPESAADGCMKLESAPSVLEQLRSRHIRAVVAQFGDSSPCSANWKPLGDSRDFYYLPL